MKKPFFLSLLSGVILSCVPGEDFEVPQATEGIEISVEKTIDLDAVLGSFLPVAEEMEVITFEEELFMEGFVVSSDEAGNFYKELVLQNSRENPTAGIAVQVNLPSYFETYDLGRKVYVNLEGLSVGLLNGVPALGIGKGKLIEQIPLSRIQHHIIRSQEVEKIIPLPISAQEFNMRKLNLYVELEDFQFSNFHINNGKTFTFASGDNDEFDGERQLQSCSGDFPFILSTSTFADFKAFRLPAGSGTIRGILTRDFYDEFFTVYLNSPADLGFSEGSRCDPALLDCGIAADTGEKVLFEEDFQEEKNNSPIAGNAWTNHIQEGSVPWEGFTATGTNASLGRSARVQVPGSGDYRSVSWLITPAIDFDTHSNEVLQFKSSTSFGNHSLLEVLFSNDWNGNVESFDLASWKVLSSAYVARMTDFFGDWIPSGKVSLDCAEGIGYIAFRYTGSDTEYYNGIFELDDVLITSD